MLTVPDSSRVEPGEEPRRPLTAFSLAWGLAALLMDAARRRFACACERRRANRVRRNPANVVDALGRAKHVLIVCHGNIIRSPFAAFLVADSARSGQTFVSSGGLQAVAGRPPHPSALAVAGRRGIDLAGHRAAPIEARSVAQADVIFVMDIPQLVEMQTRFPEARGKTFLLACLAPGLPLEVGDPVDGDEARFEACFDHVSQAVAPLVNLLSRSPRSTFVEA